MCKDGPFSILCDEGNDSHSDDNFFAILVRLWDERVGKPATRFFNIPVCNIANAQNLFQHIDDTLRSIPWSNVVGFESDTCSVMLGDTIQFSLMLNKSSLMFSFLGVYATLPISVFLLVLNIAF